MIGHEDDAPQGERAFAESGGSVAEQHHSDELTADATEAEPGYTRPSVSRKPLGCLIEIAETLILTIVIFWLIQSFVAQPYMVQQQSMHGTLEDGQYVLVDKLTPHWDNYSRGDIVVLNPIIRDGSCSGPVTAIEGDGQHAVHQARHRRAGRLHRASGWQRVRQWRPDRRAVRARRADPAIER